MVVVAHQVVGTHGAAIRRAIADGEAAPGQRIPYARDLAAVVAGNPEIGTLTTKTRELIDLARRQGYHRDELVALIYRLS